MHINSHHILTICLSAIGLFAHVTDATANIGAPLYRGAWFGSPGLAQKSSLKVRSETLTITCRQAKTSPVCSFRAVYFFENPDAQARRVTAAFFGVLTSNIQASLRGQNINTKLTPLQRMQLRKSHIATLMHARRRQMDPRRRYLQPKLAGVRLTFAGKERAKVIVTGTMRPQRAAFPGYGRSAPETRHLLLGSETKQKRYYFRYLIAPINSWKGTPKIRLKVSMPAAWRVSSTAFQKHLKREKRGDSQVYSGSLIASQVNELSWQVIPHYRSIFNGGVMLAIGADVTDGGGPRFRVAYEFAAPSWLFYALSLDTNFTNLLVLTPMLKLATPSLWIVFPSVGIGLGVPIALIPQPTAGVRFQLTVQWLLLGFVASFDLFPSFATTDPAFFAGSVYFQISL